jgi:hypothetical protein
MKILITGVCGFAGNRLAIALRDLIDNVEICGIDNLLRPGSEMNRAPVVATGVRFFHGDLRLRSDLDPLPACDWVIDAAANPSILAGIDGRSSARQVAEHNLSGTLNLLEYCRAHGAGLIVISTNRVYSVRDLAALPMRECGASFALDDTQPLPSGVSASGLTVSLFLFTGRPNLPPRSWRLNTAPRSVSLCGWIAAASWQARANLAQRSRASFLTGFMRMPRGVAYAISVSARAACRSEMRFIRTTSRCSLHSNCGAILLPSRFITWAEGLRIRCH